MTNANTIKNIFESNETLTLKKFCDVLQIGYQFVLKKSKEPIVGQPYDPNSKNYFEISKIIERKKIDVEEYDWTSIVSESKHYEPLNDIEDFQVGVEFKLRASGNYEKDDIFEVLLLTKEYIVYKQINSEKPRVMNFDTFLHQSPRVVK